MVAPGQKIALADLQALAALANAKLTPATPYSFNAFAGRDKITLPAEIVALPGYGAAGLFPSGSKVTLFLYGYKTIGGTKYFTLEKTLKAMTGDSGRGDFDVTWIWGSASGPAAPDGYIAVIPQEAFGGWEYFWKDVGSLPGFFEDGSFSDPAWKLDSTLDDNNLGFPAQNLPCGRGAWLKMMNRIRKDLFSGMDLFLGARTVFTDDFILSGPWCVSAGQKCYLKLNGTSIYKNLKFIYSEADSLTGNSLAPEADMFKSYIAPLNGANNFNWDANAKINGRMIIFSDPGETFADWTVSVSHPGIVISFNPNYFDGDFPGDRTLSAFIFDFIDVQYLAGTPVILIVMPPAGHSVTNPGNPFGGGARVDCVFTGDVVTYATTDTIAIHLAGQAAKSVALANSLTSIVFTDPAANATALETHHRSFCNGMFTANTLPTPGVMTFLDVDLPQYQPANLFPASSQRVPRNADLPYMAGVDNMASRWPVFRDMDFIPDNVAGRPLEGSLAWRTSVGTKYVSVEQFTDPIPAGILFNYSTLVPSGAADVRFYTADPNVRLYVRANDFPTLTTFDASAPGGTWLSLAETIPGFQTGTTWFYAIYNPTAGILTVSNANVIIENTVTPNGSFFPANGLDDNGAVVPQLEGYSFRFADPQNNYARPIPFLGYCVSSLTIRRQPKKNIQGAFTDVSPSTGTAALDVKIGLKVGYGFDTTGVFQELSTVTIPAGQAWVKVNVFWPVLSGTPLAYQCAEVVAVEAAVNFQPMMHSTFAPVTTKAGGQDLTVGFYQGAAWYDIQRAYLFFAGNNITFPIVLPIAAEFYNELTAALNLA